MVGLVRLVSHRLQHQTSFRQAPGIKLVRLDKPHELARFFIRNQAVEQVVGQVRTVFLLCNCGSVLGVSRPTNPAWWA